MPYPPRSPPKYKSLEEARKASNAALFPPWKPGRSGNPAAFTKSRRLQIEACEALAREHTPASIEKLVGCGTTPLTKGCNCSPPIKVSSAVSAWPQEYVPEDEAPLGSLPPEQQRQRIAELLTSVAMLQLPPDFKPATVFEAEPTEKRKGR